MLNALRLKSGVDTQLFEARTGVSIAQLMPTVNKLVSDSLLAPNPAQRLKATEHGFRFLNNVLAASSTRRKLTSLFRSAIPKIPNAVSQSSATALKFGFRSQTSAL